MVCVCLYIVYVCGICVVIYGVCVCGISSGVFVGSQKPEKDTGVLLFRSEPYSLET